MKTGLSARIKEYFFIPKETKLAISQKNVKYCTIVSYFFILCEAIFLLMELAAEPPYNMAYIIYYIILIANCILFLIVSRLIKNKDNYYLNQGIVTFACTIVCLSLMYNFFEAITFSFVISFYFAIFLLILVFELSPLFYTIIITAFYFLLMYLNLNSSNPEPNLHINNAIFCISLIFFSFYKRKIISQREKFKREIEEKNRQLGIQNIELEQQKNNLIVSKHYLEDAVLNQSQEIQLQKERLISIQENTIISLSNLIEERDNDTGDHVLRTRDYVQLIATKAFLTGNFPELTEETINCYIKAAPMHDIGKIAVPDSILRKPGKLTPEEFDEIKKHTTKGEQIVKDVLKFADEEYVKTAADIAAYHHEKYDGTGYPSGLKGNDIPLSARIMAIADVFDALVSPRCYKEPMSLEKAFGIIEESSGTHFDPVLAKLFLDSKDEVVGIFDKYR